MFWLWWSRNGFQFQLRMKHPRIVMKRCSTIWHVLFNYGNYVKNWVSLANFVKTCLTYLPLKQKLLWFLTSYSLMMMLWFCFQNWDEILKGKILKNLDRVVVYVLFKSITLTYMYSRLSRGLSVLSLYHSQTLCCTSYHGGHRGGQILHYVNNFMSFYSIFLKLGTNKELTIL